MDRPLFTRNIHFSFQGHPIVALLGPRQCGKTTLAKHYLKKFHRKMESHFFDLENPLDLARLENPLLALQDLRGLVVIDEIQRAPNLFPVPRVLVDDPSRRKTTRFLILGSASRDLLRQGAETLAGRIRFLELTPFSSTETAPTQIKNLWIRGGFPPSFLAPSEPLSADWRKGYISTFLERDIPALGLQVPAMTLRRFWLMLAHYHGQTFNASEIGRSLGAGDTTVRRYLDILEGTFMVRVLPPWVENIAKRQVKSSKIYFRDSGIFHTLLGANSERDVMNHPKLGASWEGFALEEVLRTRRAEHGEAYFWATHAEAELDLLILKNGRREGFEFKYTDHPSATKSMRIALKDLGLDNVTVVHPGKGSFPLDKKIQAIGLSDLLPPTPPSIRKKAPKKK